MRRLLLPIALLVALAAPAVAQAASYQDVINDCLNPAHNEQLTKTYTRTQYQQALDHMPTDAKEYTGCYDVIRSAMLDVGSGGTGIGVGGGGAAGVGGAAGAGTTAVNAGNPLAAATPADRAAATQAATQAATSPVRVGAAMITPGNPGTAASAIGDLPAPLLVVLAITAAAALAGSALLIKNLVLRHTAP